MFEYKNETQSPQLICLFNSMFDRGRLVEVAPNQVITSCEHCSQTVVSDYAEAQALHVGKEIKDDSVLIEIVTVRPTREGNNC